jgi:peptidyl-tRNA hydrolase, PTH1 family
VVDELAGRLACSLRRSMRFRARIGKTRFGEEPLWLVAPQTYMNHSGDSAGALLRYLKLAPPDMVVVLDDADLDVGRIRVRARGSSGGHRGLDSMIRGIGSSEFSRVRLGIGRQAEETDLVAHVLSPFSPGERRRMDRVVETAAEAVLCVLGCGPEDAMNRFNGWRLDLEDGRAQGGSSKHGPSVDSAVERGCEAGERTSSVENKD